MLDLFLSWYKNPEVQGLMLSPLIGAVMGLILGFIVQNPPASAPSSVSETRIIFIERVRSDDRTGHPDDGSWIFGLGFLLVLGITWIYARYASAGVEWWAFATLTALAFNLSAAVAGLFRRELVGTWLAYLGTPLVVLIAGLWLASIAQGNILPGAAAAAAQDGLIRFYFHALDDAQRNWLLTQGMGVLTGAAATLIAALRFTYYIALSNQRAGGWWAKIWRLIAQLTTHGAGMPGLIFMLMLFAISYILLSGTAYNIIMAQK